MRKVMLAVLVALALAGCSKSSPTGSCDCERCNRYNSDSEAFMDCLDDCCD